MVNLIRRLLSRGNAASQRRTPIFERPPGLRPEPAPPPPQPDGITWTQVAYIEGEWVVKRHG